MKAFILALLLSGNFAVPNVVLTADKNEKPPNGFVVVADLNLIVATTETSITQWLAYKRSGLNLNNSKLESNAYNSCMDNMEENAVVYYRDTTYVNTKGKKEKSKLLCGALPVTGVTYEQALEYCEWLTVLYENDPKLPDYSFRLPSRDEIQELIKRNLDAEGFVAKGFNSKGCALYNHKHNSWCEHNKDAKLKFGYAVPMPVASFFPSIDGIYDLMGNVAEMTDEKGVAIGGGCVHEATECQAETTNVYTTSEFWLGFRVVADKL